MAQEYDKKTGTLFCGFSTLLFILGIILISVGFAKYENDFMDCNNDKYTMAIIEDSNTYTTNCQYCLRLKVRYHTTEVGEVLSYMIVRTKWSGAFASLQDANEVHDVITIYYNEDNPGTPYPERRICRPPGGWFVMIIMGIIITIFGFAILILIFCVAHKSRQVILNKRPRTASRYPPQNRNLQIVAPSPEKKYSNAERKPPVSNNSDYTHEFLMGDDAEVK